MLRTGGRGRPGRFPHGSALIRIIWFPGGARRPSSTSIDSMPRGPVIDGTILIHPWRKVPLPPPWSSCSEVVLLGAPGRVASLRLRGGTARAGARAARGPPRGCRGEDPRAARASRLATAGAGSGTAAAGPSRPLRPRSTPALPHHPFARGPRWREGRVPSSGARCGSASASPGGRSVAARDYQNNKKTAEERTQLPRGQPRENKGGGNKKKTGEENTLERCFRLERLARVTHDLSPRFVSSAAQRKARPRRTPALIGFSRFPRW